MKHTSQTHNIKNKTRFRAVELHYTQVLLKNPVKNCVNAKF